jgi:hypothetical protein
MSTLQERLTEVMAAMNWGHADVMRVSRQSSSVVSQWLGKGSKVIKSIGKIDAAIALGQASGYSPTWIAKGHLPKRMPSAQDAPGVAEHAADYRVAPSPGAIIEWLGNLLAALPAERRSAVADNLAGFAREGGADVYKDILLKLLEPASTKVRKRG